MIASIIIQMLKGIRARIKTAATRGTARVGNQAYELACALRRPKLRRLAAKYPDLLVTSPEKIESQTIAIVVHRLRQAVYAATNKKIPSAEIEKIVNQGIVNGLFRNYGKAIYINNSHLDDLLERLEIAPSQKELFIKQARKRGLLEQYRYISQTPSHSRVGIRERDDKQYGETPCPFSTRDGYDLELRRIVNFDEVVSGDQAPNILFVPGTACKKSFWDLNDQESLALDIADAGSWCYLFTSRGIGKDEKQSNSDCFVDTEISNDNPAALNKIFHTSKEKPVILVGHSKGGFISLFMTIRQTYKLNLLLDKIARELNEPSLSVRGKTRPEIQDHLNDLEGKLDLLENGKKIRLLFDDAKKHLETLNMIKGIITLGSPLAFDKNSHPIFPLFLTLNILLPTFGEEAVPIDKGKWLAKKFPSLAYFARTLINSENFDDPDAFLRELTAKATDSFPLGVGFQMLKAIYSGRSIRRMSKDKFPYAEHLDLIPPDIPVAMIFGDQDVLAPPFNLAFIDPSYGKGSPVDFSRFGRFQHKRQVVHRVASLSDAEQIPLPQESSRVTGILVEGVNHLDFFYGKRGEEFVRPLLLRLIQTIWQAE